MGVMAAYFFMRGHNLPGGGFVAGLIFATALIVQYMVAGTDWVESHLRLRPHRWISWGLFCACFTGIGAWFLGYPFLTSHTAHLDLPVLGELHVPSAFMFDLGVFLVVVGLDHAHARRAGPPVAAQPPPGGRRHARHHSTCQGDPLMELVLSLAIGIVFASGIWLVLRPRSFQVLCGLMLMSYAVNLFIFAMGRLWVDAPPLTPAGTLPNPAILADPLPQALVLTAIVIGFATTALYLVVMIGSRGLTGTDHVDGKEPDL